MNGRYSRSSGGQSRRYRATGFTIVETLIVLGVTSVLFLSAVALINGRQNRTSFNQSIRSIQSELSSIANQVSSGYYNNPGSISCRSQGGRPFLQTLGADKQGTNEDCIFIGKVIQFAQAGNANGPEVYNVMTLVGLRGPVGSAGVSLDTANPVVIAPTATNAAIPDVYDAKKLQYGLSLSRAYYTRTANTNKSFIAIGFISGINGAASVDGSQTANAIRIPGTNGFDVSRPTAIERINSALGLAATNAAATQINPASGIQLCFNSGGTKQSGLITIGGAGKLGSSVDLQIFANQDCI